MYDNFGSYYVSGNGVLVVYAIFVGTQLQGFVSVPCSEGEQCTCRDIHKVAKKRMTRWQESNGVRPAVLTGSPVAKRAIKALQENVAGLQSQLDQKNKIIEEKEEEINLLKGLADSQVLLDLLSFLLPTDFLFSAD